MDDSELEEIRRRRLQEMQNQYSTAPEQQKQQEEVRRRQEEARHSILSQVLTQDARERLSRVALVKPEKARGVEDMIIRAAQSGQLGGKVDEQKLISLLEQISSQKKETKITIQRRKYSDDENW